MGISLPFEPGLNQYVTEELAFEYHYFFMRKFMMVRLLGDCQREALTRTLALLAGRTHTGAGGLPRRHGDVRRAVRDHDSRPDR